MIEYCSLIYAQAFGILGGFLGKHVRRQNQFSPGNMDGCPRGYQWWSAAQQPNYAAHLVFLRRLSIIYAHLLPFTAWQYTPKEIAAAEPGRAAGMGRFRHVAV